METNVKAAVEALIQHFGGQQSAVAEALDVKQPTISAWLNGRHGISAKFALRAQAATGGAVKAEDLCPDLRPTIPVKDNAA